MKSLKTFSMMVAVFMVLLLAMLSMERRHLDSRSMF